jgi:MHS family shikimate/dehydroshikimate transporter-like MFS transporter
VGQQHPTRPGSWPAPLGGVICGHFGDRVGRRAILQLTLVLMGVSTFAVGLLPTYQSVGVLAPVLLVGVRIVQGLATGGEFGGAALLTVEHAEARRGFWGSLLTVGILLGLVLGTLAFSVFGGLSEAQFLAWGWRMPFLISVVLVALGFYIRRRVEESPEFAEVKRDRGQARSPVVEALRAPRNVLAILSIRLAENSSFYMYSVFVLAYVTQFLHLSKSLILTAVMVAAAVECVTAIGFGVLADRIGSRPVMRAGLLFQVVFAFPFFWLLDTTAPAAVFLAVTAGMAVGNGAISAVEPDFFARFFPAATRCSGISIGRESGTIIGGGLFPLAATALLAGTHASWPIALIMAACSVLGLIALGVARERDENATSSTTAQARQPAGDPPL